MKNLLRVEKVDWERAKLFFRANKDAVYMEIGISGVRYDFIKIDGTIYALNMNMYLGAGGFGKVRVGEKEDGENFACKMEPRALKASDIYENQILNEFGMYIGMLERTSDTPISIRLGSSVITTNKMVYRIMELIPGADLSSLIAQQQLNEKQNLMVAIKTVAALKEIHDKRILHRDIKGGNIKVVIDPKEGTITVRILDFGFAYKLTASEPVKVTADRMGTEGFMAPEIISRSNPAIYSFQSDIYALGVLFRRMGLPENLYLPMINTAAYLRPDHGTILNTLISHFRTHFELSAAEESEILEIFNAIAPETKSASITHTAPVIAAPKATASTANASAAVLEEVSSNTLRTITSLVREAMLREIESVGGRIPEAAQEKAKKRKTRASAPVEAVKKVQGDLRLGKVPQGTRRSSQPPARLPPEPPVRVLAQAPAKVQTQPPAMSLPPLPPARQQPSVPKATGPQPINPPAFLPHFRRDTQVGIPVEAIQAQYFRIVKPQV